MFDFGPKAAIPLAHSPTPLKEANMQAVLNKIIHGDCLKVMPLLPDKSTDIILCDLPYGLLLASGILLFPLNHYGSSMRGSLRIME
jgi:DNA modification methylase